MRAVAWPKRPQFPRLLTRLANRAGDVWVRPINPPAQQLIDEDTRGFRMWGPHSHRDVWSNVQGGVYDYSGGGDLLALGEHVEPGLQGRA
eukprot:10385855-Alexandrium_andersonii.AAC.1